MKFCRQQGFTLIEVLLASMILFISIATASLALKSVVTNKSKLEQRVLAVQNIPFLMDEIEYEVKLTNSKEISGNKVIEGMSYYWVGKVTQSKKPKSGVDLESNSNVIIDRTFYSWDIEITVSTGNWNKKYRYKELSWSEVTPVGGA